MAAPAELTHANPSQPESATTLSTIVELVRRIMHADIACIVDFSFANQTITWKAISGFRNHSLDDLGPFIHQQASGIVIQALKEGKVGVLNDIGVSPKFTRENFPITIP